MIHVSKISIWTFVVIIIYLITKQLCQFHFHIYEINCLCLTRNGLLQYFTIFNDVLCTFFFLKYFYICIFNYLLNNIISKYPYIYIKFTRKVCKFKWIIKTKHLMYCVIIILSFPLHVIVYMEMEKYIILYFISIIYLLYFIRLFIYKIIYNNIYYICLNIWLYVCSVFYINYALWGLYEENFQAVLCFKVHLYLYGMISNVYIYNIEILNTIQYKYLLFLLCFALIKYI